MQIYSSGYSPLLDELKYQIYWTTPYLMVYVQLFRKRFPVGHLVINPVEAKLLDIGQNPPRGIGQCRKVVECDVFWES